MKSSTATVRARPLAGVTTASGPLKVHAETFTVDTASRVQLIDLTDRVAAIARRSGIGDGTISVVSLHTTCTVIINEHQRALLDDIQTLLEHVVDQHGGWRHNDPQYSDCDRLNADAHLRAMLLGHTLTLQIAGGELVLGQWQRILLAELDGPRTRTLRASGMGV
jgi:secondary thiamine-phosphate synthase enzyme